MRDQYWLYILVNSKPRQEKYEFDNPRGVSEMMSYDGEAMQRFRAAGARGLREKNGNGQTSRDYRERIGV